MSLMGSFTIINRSYRELVLFFFFFVQETMTCNFGVIYSLLRVLVSRREKRKREPLREFRLHNRSVNLIVAPKRPEETKKKKKRKTKRVNGLLTNFYQARTINRHIRIRFSFIFLSLSLQGGNNDEDNIRRTLEFPFSSRRENDTIEK